MVAGVKPQHQVIETQDVEGSLHCFHSERLSRGSWGMHGYIKPIMDQVGKKIEPGSSEGQQSRVSREQGAIAGQAIADQGPH